MKPEPIPMPADVMAVFILAGLFIGAALAAIGYFALMDWLEERKRRRAQKPK